MRPLSEHSRSMFDGLRLIALGLEIGDKFKLVHAIILQQKRKEGKGGIRNAGKPLYE